MTDAVGAPTLYNTQDAFRGAYAARSDAFIAAGRSAGLAPAENDREKIALVLVDFQHDFVDPNGTLYVPGSQHDVARLLTWFYANAHRISSIYASLDTHVPLQIFFSSWWRHAQTGEHPQAYTVITADDVVGGLWQPIFQSEWSLSYVRHLQQQAKKDLMIWPAHTMQGTLGHMLVAPISEAISWHSAARNTQPTYIVKGQTLRTEYYGIFGAEVPDPQDAQSALNLPLLDAVMQHDKVYIAGEAKSHCVLETERQLVNRFGDRSAFMQRLHFLRDCTSSVQHPVIDFDALAEQELANMQRQGVQLVSSTDPV